ncbi:MAG: glycosyltransferase [Rhodobacterales bacterium]|nr:glycosyltransferase [Rhodobacterales bacterium]
MFHFSPLPPARNGIADYAGVINAALARRVRLTCLTADPFARVPEGVGILDPLQALRNLPGDGAGVVPLYQIGNNPDHLDIHRQALRWPGVVVLHDLRLFYLHELMGLVPDRFGAMMTACNPVMAALRRDPVVRRGAKIASDYLCFDMLWDLVQRSRLIVVHSHYARSILARHYGPQAADRIVVIPHFAEPPDPARGALPRPPRGEGPLIVTSGFATKVKRFDWVAQALAALAARGLAFRWVHAGAERPEEYDLSAEIARHSVLAGRSTVTGYLDEAQLDGWLGAADIVVNLRFPSVGESSGTLARAMAAGRCCVVTRTAAYDELPEGAVVKVSPHDPVAGLSAALAALIAQPEARAAFGAAARAHAAAHLSVEACVAALVGVLDRARAMPVAADGPSLLDRPLDGDRLVLGPWPETGLTRAGIEAAVPRGFVARGMRLRPAGPGQVTVELAGIDTPWPRGPRARRCAGGRVMDPAAPPPWRLADLRAVLAVVEAADPRALYLELDFPLHRLVHARPDRQLRLLPPPSVAGPQDGVGAFCARFRPADPAGPAAGAPDPLPAPQALGAGPWLVGRPEALAAVARDTDLTGLPALISALDDRERAAVHDLAAALGRRVVGFADPAGGLRPWVALPVPGAPGLTLPPLPPAVLPAPDVPPAPLRIPALALVTDIGWPAEGDRVSSWIWTGPEILHRICLGDPPQDLDRIGLRVTESPLHTGLDGQLALQLNGRRVAYRGETPDVAGGTVWVDLPAGLARPVVLGVAAFPARPRAPAGDKTLRVCLRGLELCP